MSPQFNPAPLDKHAVSPAEAARLDRATSENLKAGLVGSFPASDPASSTIPAPSKEPRAGLWSRLVSFFLPD